MSPQKKKKPSQTGSGLQRLQRVMASAGVASRRECELIIQEGRVEVDGQIVMTLGTKVDPDKQAIFVDGQKLSLEKLQYFLLNKPPGVVSTSNDPSGRVRVIDLIKTERRVYNVGRLDQSSEGLILVTNDGELANLLTHPRYGVEKKYHVQVAGVPSPHELKALEKGVYIAEGKAKATSVKFLRKVKNSSWIEIVLAEGRNREIRRMLASIGHKVRTLKRVAIGPLRLKDLPVGAHRELTAYEVKQLKRLVEGPQPKPKSKSKKKGGKQTKSSSRRASKPASKKSSGKRTNTKKSTARKSTARKSEAKKSTTRKQTDKRKSKKSVKRKSPKQPGRQKKR